MNTFDAMKAAQKLLDEAFNKAMESNHWIDLVTGKIVAVQLTNKEGLIDIKCVSNEDVEIGTTRENWRSDEEFEAFKLK